MTQPKYAPIESADEVRPIAELTPAAPWFSHRPAEKAHGARRVSRGIGVPGPDQGYALLLARGLADKLVLESGEYQDDVLTAAVMIGLRRAALYGRAPVLIDLEVALTLFGYLAAAPTDLVDYRRSLISGIGHDYRAQRELVDAIPASSLSRRPDELRSDLVDWRTLVGQAPSH